MSKQCDVKGCDRLFHCKKWCRTHYLRWYRHGDPLIKLARSGNRTARPAPSFRKCRHCLKEAPSTEFKPQSNTCKGCNQERLRKWKIENPERVAAGIERQKASGGYLRRELRRRAKNLGLDPDMVLAYYQAHNGQCEICGSAPRPGGRDLNMDHDHQTGVFRGLLCDNCNNGLGRFKDSIGNLLLAVTYLQKHQSDRDSISARNHSATASSVSETDLQ